MWWRRPALREDFIKQRAKKAAPQGLPFFVFGSSPGMCRGDSGEGGKAFYVWLLPLLRLPQVVVGLYAEPGAGGADAGKLQAYSEIRADWRMPVQDTGQGFAGEAQAAGQLCDAQVQRGECVLEERFAGMWRVEHDQGGVLLLFFFPVSGRRHRRLRRA